MTTPDDLLPVGLEDALPDRARTITTAMRAVLDAMDGHGYDRVRPPLVEFERSLAGRMDGVATRRMVRFTDPDSLRTLALRSDMTVQVGRIAATGMAAAVDGATKERILSMFRAWDEDGDGMITEEELRGDGSS